MKPWWSRETLDSIPFLFAGVVILLFLLLLSVLSMGMARAASCTSMSGIEPRYLTHQMDGDTISIFSIPHGKLKFRIQDIDTPERKQSGWSEARAFTWQWLHKGPFDLATCWKPTLDRYVGIVSRNGETLAEALRHAGHAKP